MNPFSSNPSSRVPQRDKGIALIVVLSCLLLVSGLVLSFFMSVSTETKASKLADSGGRSKDLVDTAVNIVMAQIRTATTGGANVAWASQPGMIRTYGEESGDASANALANYKLYSSARMIWKTGEDPFDPAVDVPPIWSTVPSLFTDLNQPMRDLQDNLQYPIVDPSSLDLPDNQRPKGFSITGAPVSATQPAGVPANTAPMPVRWLYVLSDGTLTSPATGVAAGTSGGATATWNVGDPKAPTKNNPIVGRVAFWTDDDTSKININTAAGDLWTDTDASAPGTFWDVPRSWSPLDVTFAQKQLVNGEFQRYPGHPATVYLSAVFPDLTRAQIGAIVPRIKDEGSKGGTIAAGIPINPDSDRLYASIDELVFKPDRTTQAGITQSQLERGRFFLTAGSRAPETTLFNTPRVSIWPLSRNTSTSSTAAARTPYDSLIAFCATMGEHPYYFTRDTASRSSSLPREHANSPWLDYYGNRTYGSEDGQVDAVRNRNLFKYLQVLTERATPGFSSGTTFKDKYNSDRDQILTEIFDYIRSTNLFDDSLLPASDRFTNNGKQFTGARNGETGTTAGHGQVAPIRIPDATTPGDRRLDNMGFGRFHTISEMALAFICTADGSVDPTKTSPSAEEQQKIKSNTAANNTLKGITNPDTARGVPLKVDERRVEAMFLFELFSPAQGWTGLHGDLRIRVKGLDQFTIAGTGETPKPMQFPASADLLQTGGSVHDGRAWGGSNGIRFVFSGRRLPQRGGTAADTGHNANSNGYPFISFPLTIKVPTTSSTMAFTGGRIEVEIYADASEAAAEKGLVQTFVVDVPSGTFPVPKLVTEGTNNTFGTSSSGQQYFMAPATLPEFWWTFGRDGVFYTTNSPVPNIDAGPTTGVAGRLMTANKAQGSNGRDVNGATNARAGAIFRREDVVRSLMPYHGDFRLIASSPYVFQDLNGKGLFQPHAEWNNTAFNLAHTFQVEANSSALQRDFDSSTSDSNVATPWRNQPSGKLIAKAQYSTARFPDGPFVFPYGTDGKPVVPAGFSSVTQPETYGDWDSGVTVVPDGAYINKPDEGNDFRNGGAGIPYYDVNWTQQSGGITLFSPNRQVPSAAMFGSLPSGAKAGIPWQTLLFRPDVTGANVSAPTTHPGVRTGYPKDHLLLDLFWMPVVEPYAISEPLSTAGKINMNYQLMPFTYIERSTAIRALLRSERVTAIPFASASTYKNNGGTKIPETRLPINADATLIQFKDRFSKGDIFRSASEICDLHLVPTSVSIPASGNATTIFINMKNFWANNRLTGDNLRERPYATLYPRLTTKSNTYTVHYRVQALQQGSRRRGDSASAWATWEESADALLSETRGSTTIERYVDPLDPSLLDFAEEMTDDSEEALDDAYRFRVISTKRFAP